MPVKKISYKRLLEIAENLFRIHGYHRTSIDDIAKEMGRKRSALYYYYKSKDDILKALIIKEGLDVQKKIQMRIVKSRSATERLRSFLLEYCNVVQEKSIDYEVLQKEIRNGEIVSYNESYTAKYLKELNDMGKRIIRDILILGVDRNEFRKNILDTLDSSVDVVFTIMITVLVELSKEENFGEIQSGRQSALLDIILGGLKA